MCAARLCDCQRPGNPPDFWHVTRRSGHAMVEWMRRRSNRIDTSTARQSVYQRVLGDDFTTLAPELRAYFARPPAGTVGRGVGVFEVAGSRIRWLRPVFAWLAWRRVLFPELGNDVPFTVTNTPDGDVLRAVREFRFPGVTRFSVDELRVVDGRIHDFVGRRRGLEVRFGIRVEDGALRMTSDRVWLRVLGLRIPLPGALSARVDLTERWDGDAQHVDVRLDNPVLGRVFEYRGRFEYRYA